MFNEYIQGNIRDWSLITGRGGLQNGRRGGHVKYYPYEKGGGGVLAILEGGGAQKVSTLGGGGAKRLTLS